MPDHHHPSASKRQPKLRSSCDACGIAKLRCDRAQPECGRCVSYGLPCVYGVSRRMGKAPGGGVGRRTSVTQRQSGGTGIGMGMDRRHNNQNNSNNSSGGGGGNNDTDAVMMDLSLFAGLSDIPTSFEMLDCNTTTTTTTDALIDSYLHGSSSSSLLNIASSFDFDSKPALLAHAELSAGADDYSYDLIPHDFQPGQLVYTQEETPELGDYSSTSASTLRPSTSQTQVEKQQRLEDAEREFSIGGDVQPGMGISGHRCYMHAYEILRSLSLLKIRREDQQQQQKFLQSAKTEDTTTTMQNANANWVPFDHVLRINRETSERLSSLLTCSCARSSHLTLLHASIICRVLSLYQQAAACTQQGGGLWNPTTLDPSCRHFSPARQGSPDPVSGSLATWSGTTAAGNSTTSGAVTTMTQSSNNFTVTPSKMAVGNFNIDDHRVQTAVNIQLVLGEMRRTERLIDQFTSSRESSSSSSSRNGGADQHLDDEAAFGGAVDSLCRSLDSWLRAEHARIVSVMRIQLRKVNT